MPPQNASMPVCMARLHFCGAKTKLVPNISLRGLRKPQVTFYYATFSKVSSVTCRQYLEVPKRVLVPFGPFLKIEHFGIQPLRDFGVLYEVSFLEEVEHVGKV